ncbi:ral guanine nucleotide dissociation stimulator-like [Leptonychotes weddellii]|uniref:Ral guanine nucleotide dissociation stimulator-like n=1 Tax=Leptonychotes weddellii TaxID=9713 RepID=A0A2U3Z2Z1_LEPWE|nr:ral guanine nucleotide dissociation stimulator-like [Leptonychotes weddellii]
MSAQPSFLKLLVMWQETPTESKPTQAPEASCHRYITPKNQLNEEKPDLLDFPPKLVAEQLTYMDAELFKTVLPQQCLGSIWTKRNKPGNEHLAPTVWATVAQFNGVANCVITTCLGNPSMTARDRAMVVEHWIKVAKDQPSNKFASLLMNLQRGWKRVQKKGVIPYLGTFLTDLVMPDTAMEDYLEMEIIFFDHNAMELEINHKKKPRKTMYTWTLNNMLLNNEWVNHELKEEIKNYMETNKNDMTGVPKFGIQQK